MSTQTGTNSDDVLIGSANADTIEGLAGNDTINGGEGDDEIYGGVGDDDLYGASGNDELYGADGNDELFGGNGDDFIRGGDGTDTINGGADNDTIYGGTDDDLIQGDAGDDTINGEDGNDTIYGGVGDDELYGGAGDDELYGADGNDDLYGANGDDSLRGGDGTDAINGGAGDDTIEGGAKSDTINGGADDDSILGDAGDDTINGEDGNDTIYGGTDDDSLLGGAGDDVINGEDGNDTIYGGTDNDLIQGGAGDDTINGEDGNDTIYGGVGDDDLYGGYGNDTLYAADGNDKLFGGNGDDSLVGGDGAETIQGGAGTDRIIGGAGDDTLIGGAGTDVVNYFLEGGSLGITFNFDTHMNTITDTFGDTDTIEDIEIIHGTSHSDSMLGSNANDVFYTYGGANTINAGDGNNLIFLEGNLDGTEITVGTTIEDTRDHLHFGSGNTGRSTSGNIIISDNSTTTIGSNYAHHLVFEKMTTAVTVNLGGVTGYMTEEKAYKVTWDSGSLDFSDAPYFLEVVGSPYDDLLVGGNENHDDLEWFTGGNGNDTIHGGSGAQDTVIYSTLNPDEDGNHPGVTIVLDDPIARTPLTETELFEDYRHTVQTLGYAYGQYEDHSTVIDEDRDTLINIDHAHGSMGADHITGSYENNSFWTLAGEDTINGGPGVDTVIFREDVDNLNDHVPGPTQGIDVDLKVDDDVLREHEVTNDGYGYAGILTNIQNIVGTRFNDTIVGNADTNRLVGHEEDDYLSGEYGNDTLLGGSGEDHLLGGHGSDNLVGGAGNDSLSGGAQADTFDFDLGFGNDTITDFAVGEDILRFSSNLINLENDTPTVMHSPEGLSITFESAFGASIFLAGLSSSDHLTGESFALWPMIA
ncbi:MAG: calcium-binding protein [Shimia thalassica]|uniref:calcium-binding protein n=1 Tax=Shimia thalassica TaxID=1715693 RepID=UPI0032978240